MPLHDLARAVPGLLVAVLLPGFALATLAAPRWAAWQRLAGAPGLSAGFLGVLGLGMRLVHVPFAPQTVFPCIVLLTVAAAVRWRRVHPDPDAPDRHPRWLPIPALVAGAAGAAMLAWALSAQVLPPDWDPRVHGALATAIARSHDVLPLFPIPLQGTSFAYARPGFEAMAAVVSWVGGPSPTQSMVPIVVAVLVLMPLGLTMLALEATGSLALAAVVPLVAVGLAFPSLQAIVGRFPQVIDSTLVAPLIVAAMRVIRGRRTLDNAAIVLAATASIWVVHGLEVLTAVVVGGVLLLATLVAATRAAGWIALARAGAAAAAAAAGAVLVAVMTRLPHGPPASVLEPSTVPPQPVSAPVDWHWILQLFTQSDLVSPVGIALFCVGAVALLVRRRALWALAAAVVVVLATADSLYWRHLGSFWRNTVFPYGDMDRLAGLMYWVIPIITTSGLLAVAWLIRRLATDRRTAVVATVLAALAAALVYVERSRLERRYVAVVGTPPIEIPPLGVSDRLTSLGSWRRTITIVLGFLGGGWILQVALSNLPGSLRARLRQPAWLDAAALAVAAVAVVSLAVGARSDHDVYQLAITERATATPADVAVLEQMSATLPRGALVATNGLSDAGIWVEGLTDLTPLVPPGSELGALSIPVVSALADACNNPSAAAAAVLRADAVFVGSHHVPGTAPLWDAQCIAQLPDVRRIADAPWQGSDAVAFIVIH